MKQALRGGGLLVSLGTGPFPFFYNERGDAVVSAGRSGLPVRGSDGGAGRAGVWETPPAGVTLDLEIDTKLLPGLPPSAPFPASGDLRWRPNVREALAEGDLYVPLAKLRDEKGRQYGDGMAYIEHRASEPGGGKTVYAWMRMADVVDADELYFALFRLAAEKARGEK